MSNSVVTSVSEEPMSSWTLSRRRLPDSVATKNQPIIIGYTHDPKSEKVEQFIHDGGIVIIWSFLHLDVTTEENPQMDDSQAPQQRGRIRTDLDLDAIKEIRKKYDHVIHLAAFGGWNGPHPPVVAPKSTQGTSYSFTGKDWCNIFMEFNKSHGYLFDGIDWDYEGHDNLKSHAAKFTLETLDIMADFSVEAKQTYGMIVTMAPAESYLDASIEPGRIDEQFSLELNFPPRAWTSSRYYATEEDRNLIQSAGFSHAGRQCYAYVLAKAGVETFDWISIQLYEAYSPFAHDVSRKKLDPVEALLTRIHRLITGYTVTGLPELSSSEFEVKIPPSKLVLGVANRWADGVKFCRVEPSSLRSAYDSTLEKYDEGFLGVMFWTIEEEGTDDKSRLTYSLARAFQHNNELSKHISEQFGEF